MKVHVVPTPAVLFAAVVVCSMIAAAVVGGEVTGKALAELKPMTGAPTIAITAANMWATSALADLTNSVDWSNLPIESLPPSF